MSKRFPKHQNYLVGKCAVGISSRYAGYLFGCSRHRVYYHKRKVVAGKPKSIIFLSPCQDGQFHSRPHGGSSYFPKSPFARGSEGYRRVAAALWWKCKQCPTTTVFEYKLFVAEKIGILISESSIRRIFKAWGWSWKKPSYVQLAKFSVENISYYVDFVVWLVRQNPLRCKFLDEAHFSSRHLSPQLALGESGPVIVIRNTSLSGSRTITILTDLTKPASPLFVHAKNGENNRFDFFQFVLEAVAEGYLKSGDFLILDNASVHKAEDTLSVLQQILGQFNILVVFLPTYSPELNPCELCFSQIKSGFRSLRNGTNFDHALALSVQRVLHSNVWNYYRKCFEVLHKYRTQ